jgi:NAD(P)-dependent dehydrogenase (short-subunit alcohol dehydrogenase family)
MRIIVIDGQGGGIGKQLVGALKDINGAEIIAIGTNSIATGAMLKAGASEAATGENAVIAACRKADVIVGPVGIAVADSLLGEITPAMAVAVGQSDARKVLIPMNKCDIFICGCISKPMASYLNEAVEQIRTLA